jgi:hypothetical protein
VPKKYLHKPVGLHELRSLRQLALRELDAFFLRNPHLVVLYRRRLVAAALCQGAALQFLGCGYGVNDFDVHFFYAQNPRKPRLSRAVYHQTASVGAFPDVRVDFIRTVIPLRAFHPRVREPAARIRSFLKQAATANAKHLASKAVVGLLPSSIFGMRIWPEAAG